MHILGTFSCFNMQLDLLTPIFFTSVYLKDIYKSFKQTGKIQPVSKLTTSVNL